ncbi:MAG: hypothetical protein JOS17DRAFT_330983 [Linnemannia elongata]|nr:MAG: hypothetical protein JOS17DRAFT_330983 [Linnemannia elongata]
MSCLCPPTIPRLFPHLLLDHGPPESSFHFSPLTFVLSVTSTFTLPTLLTPQKFQSTPPFAFQQQQQFSPFDMRFTSLFFPTCKAGTRAIQLYERFYVHDGREEAMMSDVKRDRKGINQTWFQLNERRNALVQFRSFVSPPPPPPSPSLSHTLSTVFFSLLLVTPFLCVYIFFGMLLCALCWFFITLRVCLQRSKILRDM